MQILDNTDFIEKMGISIFEKLDNLPDDIRKLSALGAKKQITFSKDLEHIYIMGDTEGRIAGYLLQTLLLYDSEIPILVEDSDSLPGFVDEKTLVFAIFQQENYNKIIGKLNECIQKKCEIICFTEELKVDINYQTNVRLLIIPDYLTYSFGNHYIFLVILFLLTKNKLIQKDFDGDFSEMIGFISYLKGDYSITHPFELNRAKQMASCLQKSVIFLYGSFGTTDSIAKRWSHQLSKNHYLINHFILPDADIKLPFYSTSQISPNKKIVLLIDNNDDSRIIAKYNEIKSMAEKKYIEVEEISGWGNSKLSKIVTSCFLIDYINNYLVILGKL